MKKISICIPTYKRPEKIERLLHSIGIQTFTDFEIVITDDSPDASVADVVSRFAALPISYVKNEKALGTPANWNRAISLATGEWIKLMHDDDWFRSADSLEQFAQKTVENKVFIFSGYATVFETGEEKKSRFPLLKRTLLLKEPVSLLAENSIGTPSVTMVHRNFTELYDERMKWRVDIDYYIRLLKQEQDFALIAGPLVNVGMSSNQVTNFCIDKPEVELPEGLLLLEKYGVTPLKNLVVYDAWWRILRNSSVRRKEQLYQYTPGANWPQVIVRMTGHQSKIPARLLRIGLLSKSMMLLSYFLNRKHLAGNT